MDWKSYCLRLYREEPVNTNRCNQVLRDVLFLLSLADVCFIGGYLLSLLSINTLRNMKKHLLFLILCLMGILTSCSQKHTRYYIGVSQCSDDEWRHKMNHEIVREALFYDGVEVEIRTAKDNNRNQIEDINYFIDRKVDLLIVAPNEAAAVTPVVEKAYGLGIPVVVIDRKILSDRYTAFVGADNCEIGKGGTIYCEPFGWKREDFGDNGTGRFHSGYGAS